MAFRGSSLMKAFFLLAMMLMQVHTTQSKHIVHPFQFIKQLEGSQIGQSITDLHKVKQYLGKFGYLHNTQTKQYQNNNISGHVNDDEFDHLLESAIKAYQFNYHLNVTGRLDDCTVNQMMMPRCGVPDVIINVSANSSLDEVSHYEYFRGNLKWPPSKSHLKYRFRSSALQVPGAEKISSICAQAFQRWAEVSHFTFEEVAQDSAAAADIEIGFHRGEHGDGAPFDGPDGVVAHATAPTGGAFHYDADESWSSNPGPYEMDLESVALHEIGHLLGLAHTFVQDAVMYPYIDSGVTKRELHGDDVQGLRSLYGLP